MEKGSEMNQQTGATRQARFQAGCAYVAQAFRDIVHSGDWLRVILILALLSYIPIFGAIVLYGFLLRWVREAAWKMDTPMRPRVLDNFDGQLYSYGWRAYVLAVVYSLIPALVAAALVVWHVTAALSDVIGSAFGGYIVTVEDVDVTLPIQAVIAVNALQWLMYPFLWMGLVRMVLYRDVAAGLQVGTLIQMMRRDLGGLLFIWLFYCVIITALGLVSDMLVDRFDLLGILYDGSGLLVAKMLVIVYLLADSAVTVLVTAITLRAVGHWAAQLDVEHWGPKESPLPPRATS